MAEQHVEGFWSLQVGGGWGCEGTFVAANMYLDVAALAVV
jgi:hypothetical protein